MTLMFADRSDADELAAMAGEIWRGYFPDIIGADQTEYMIGKFQTADAILGQMDDGFRYGFITDDGRKAGYFAFRPEEDALFMGRLYVLEGFRGRGLGSRTLQGMLEIGRELGVRRMYLRVNVNNLSAIAAYERNGFTVAEADSVLDIGEGYVMHDHIYEHVY
jgi:ribosomal protein S18 acetylase RimI-like enzyme